MADGRPISEPRACALGYFGSLIALLVLSTSIFAAEENPLTYDVRMRMQAEWERTIEAMTKRVSANPNDSDAFSKRGDAYFFLGKFAEAVADYDAMVKLDESVDASHWRRGIALFYAGRYADAAAQFERYHSFDNVDRENGIWRYLCQVKAIGRDKARANLLKYEKDDREPFPAVYKLFAGQTTPDAIYQSITSADLLPGERDKRLFYAALYIGLNEAIEDRPESAAKNLRTAVQIPWGQTNGYGPAYMWQVGRLHEDLLRKAAAAKPKTKK